MIQFIKCSPNFKLKKFINNVIDQIY